MEHRYPGNEDEFDAWLNAMNLERVFRCEDGELLIPGFVRFRGMPRFLELKLSPFVTVEKRPEIVARDFRLFTVQILTGFLGVANNSSSELNDLVGALQQEQRPDVLLMLADWIEEHGDPTRAELARRFYRNLPFG